MSSSNNSSSFEEEFKTNSISIRSYVGRLILRTHQDEDTEILASIFSDPIARKYLVFLQPPNGWGDDDDERKTNKIWTKQDFADRVSVQNQTRSKGQSCVFNIILLASTSGEKTDRCIGTTGYVTINGSIAYLGIITDPKTVRRGYATEALYTSIVFAFQRLGVNQIIMQTDERNEEMRGWCEHTAGIPMINKQQKELNGITFVQCEYSFTLDQWNHSIKTKLENRMNQYFK